MTRSITRWLSLIALSLAFAQVQAQAAHSAQVLETMNGGGYTYMKVSEGDKTFWVALPETKVSVGETVSFSEQMWMRDFQSRSIDRRFDRIMFASRGDGGNAHAGMSFGSSAKADDISEAIKVGKAEGGYTVEELYANKADLKGKQVKVQGKVVKVSKAIMGLNWVHVRDGSGEGKTANVIFRTGGQTPGVGSVVTAEGRLETDKDFGYGYTYAVLVEDSTFSD